VFRIFPDLENIGLDTLIRQIGQVFTEILRILVILIMAAAN